MNTAIDPLSKTQPALIATPSVSFGTLAKVIGGLSSAELARTLRAYKHRSAGPKLSYRAARAQAVSLLVDKTPLDPDAPLRSHEREAIQAMARVRDFGLPLWVRASRPEPSGLSWFLGGVRVSMHPDVELEGLIESGAVKFSFTKKPLVRGVGSTMAALLWYWKAVVLDDHKVRASHCIVYEPRLPWRHVPGKRPLDQVRHAEIACRTIAGLWPVL